MAPSAVSEDISHPQTIKEKVQSVLPDRSNDLNSLGQETNGANVASTNGNTSLHIQHRVPLQLSGALEKFKYFDSTPVIGREYVDVDLAEWLRAENSDELLRDLAITSGS